MSSRYDAVKQQIFRGGRTITYYKSTPHDESLYAVSNETQVLTTSITLYGEKNLIGRTVDWDGDRTVIVSGSQVLTSGSWVGTPSVDYSINYNTGVVTRINTGQIPSGANVLVSYEWQRPCIDVINGTPNKTCPQCSGTGYTLDTGSITIGLPHIPKYDSPYTKSGYWQTGDLMLTVPSEFNINLNYTGTDKLLVRDRVLLDSEEWAVIAKPEQIQLQDEVLASKIHLRRVTKLI